MADRNDYLVDPFSSPVPQWHYFQFQYRGGETVVVATPEGAQHVFHVHKGGYLTPSRQKCRVTPGPVSTQGFFALAINNSTSVRMRSHKDGICRGTAEHWAGEWTMLSKTTLQMAAQGLNVPSQPSPWNQGKGKTAQGQWLDGGMPAPLDPVPTWAGTPEQTDPFGFKQHPSGLPDWELEECKACGHNPGGCHECLNTGFVPKTQQRSKPMNTAEMIAVMQIQQGAKVVACVYTNHNGPTTSQDYHFKNVAALPLAKDDLVVVQTGRGYSLAMVVDPDVRVNTVQIPLGDLKHVVSKVNLAALHKVLEGENNAMHALALSEVTERVNKYKEQLGDGTFNSMRELLAPPAEPTE